jgi:hypothetical protein
MQQENNALPLQLASKSYLQALLIDGEEPVKRNRRRSSMFAVSSIGRLSSGSIVLNQKPNHKNSPPSNSPGSNPRPPPDSPQSLTVASSDRDETSSTQPTIEDESASPIKYHMRKMASVGGLMNTASILHSTVHANGGQNKVAPSSSPDGKRKKTDVRRERRESVILPFLNRKTMDAHGCMLDETTQALLQEKKETMLFWMGKHMFYKILNALRLINCFFLAMFFVQIIPLSIKEESYVVLIAASIPSFLVLGALQPAILQLYSFVCAIGHMKAEVHRVPSIFHTCSFFVLVHSCHFLMFVSIADWCPVLFAYEGFREGVRNSKGSRYYT